MPNSPGWGVTTIGRLQMRETFEVDEGGGESRTLGLAGQEASPDLTRDEFLLRHDGILALNDPLLPVTFTDKPERDGYYTVKSATAKYVEYVGDIIKSDWTMELARLGSASEVDLQTRLTGAHRNNSFGASGERWQAPPIGHYGYYAQGGNPSILTRTGADGAITVYRGVPAGALPRYGCAPSAYFAGAARLTVGGAALAGTDRPLPTSSWALTNGLVNIVPAASGSGATLDVQSYTGGAWRSKLWNISDGSVLTSWLGVTLLRNDAEQVIVRLVGGTQPGRVTVDLTLRRGSRFVEAYVQRSTSATLSVFLTSSETTTNNLAASGYVVATSNDAAGNKYVAGSAAASTTAHANGGVSKTSTVALDVFMGVAAGGSSAVSGDTAVHLRDQYIGAVSELVSVVRR